MKRVVSLGITTETIPLAQKPQEHILATHVEPIGLIRDRGDIVAYSRVTKFKIGQNNLVADIEQTVDPLPGTHLESYYPRRPWYPEELGREIFARDITRIPTTELVGEAAIIDLSDINRQTINSNDLENRGEHVKEGDLVLIRTGFSDQYYGKLPSSESYDKSPGFTMDAARWLVDKKINLIGVDFRYLEAPEVFAEAGDLKVHELFHLNKISIIEDVVRLNQIQNKRIFVACGRPLKTRHLTGGAARLMAIDDNRLIDISHPLNIQIQANEAINREESFRLKSHIYKWARILDFNVWDHGWTASGGPQIFSYNSRLGTHLLSSCAIDQIPLPNLLKSAKMVDIYRIGSGRLIDTKTLKTAIGKLEQESVVLYTGFSEHYYHLDEFIDYSPGLSFDAAKMLVDMGVKLVIIDTPVIDLQTPSSGKEPEEVALKYLLQNDVNVVACAANIGLIRKEVFNVMLLPLPIAGLDNVPTDVIAIEDWN